jgi:cytochrome b pre-mRNA-processing protein 3
MLTRLKMWQNRRRQARALYESIVTQARTRSFYADLGVPDTPEGRFEMVALHLVLILHRLGRLEGEAGAVAQRLARTLTETFAADLDDNFREMSVGDLAVPRQVKRAVGALHARYGGYLAALADADAAALTVAIQSRFRGAGAGQGLDALRICAYIRRAEHRLGQEPTAEMLAGRIAWPPVDGQHIDGPHIDAAEPDVAARGMTEEEHAR